MKRIETMKCRYPYLFWIGWFSIALWMVFAIMNQALGYIFIMHSVFDSYSYFLILLAMFAMFRSLDWSEVDYFFFVKHPGRLRKIGGDFVLMFIIIVGPIKIELLMNTMVLISLAIYLYDMFKLSGLNCVLTINIVSHIRKNWKKSAIPSLRQYNELSIK